MIWKSSITIAADRWYLHGKAKVLLMELGGKDVHISLSHSDGQAAAMAVLEG